MHPQPDIYDVNIYCLFLYWEMKVGIENALPLGTALSLCLHTAALNLKTRLLNYRDLITKNTFWLGDGFLIRGFPGCTYNTLVHTSLSSLPTKGNR